jgi:membrane-bound lytic murein transglycosylase MltF
MKGNQKFIIGWEDICMIWRGKIITLLNFITFLSLYSCSDQQKQETLPPETTQTSDLKRIKKSGVLIALADFNSTDYFLYRSAPMGFQYEILQSFAKHLGVKLEIIVNNNMEETFENLLNGKCDIIAENLTVTKERTKFLTFTEPNLQTRQVLIQRKPKDWKLKSTDEIEKELIRNQLDLAGKKVYVPKQSAYAKRLHSLSDEIGDTIEVVETTRYNSEELIEMVATKQLDYTVCDELIALVNAQYYPDIDVKTAVSFPQNVAWALRKGSTELKNEIDTWMKNFKQKPEFTNIFNKYFLHPRVSDFFERDENLIAESKKPDTEKPDIEKSETKRTKPEKNELKKSEIKKTITKSEQNKNNEELYVTNIELSQNKSGVNENKNIENLVEKIEKQGKKIKLSKYDEIIKVESQKLGWDWRLLASLIYTESRFKPNARSWAGAYGLMQIMPNTFRQLHSDSSATPAQNIALGVRYIRWIDNQLSNRIPDKTERTKFVLAAYNVGLSHVEDAMNLTEKYGKKVYKWENHVAFYLKLKSNPKYYKDEVVKNGYCKGNIACLYVDEILERFNHYTNLILD